MKYFILTLGDTVVFMQNCECGHYAEWIWDVPVPGDKSETTKVIETIKPVYKTYYTFPFK